MRSWPPALLLALLLAASGCASSAATPTASPRPSVPTGDASAAASPVAASPSAAAAASFDAGSAEAELDRLLELLEAIHPEPFHGVPRDEFVARLRQIQDEIAASTPEETMVAVMDLVAMLSREGRDGHQLAFPANGGPMLPIRVFEFSDGVFITDAIDTALVGARITAIGEHPIQDVLATLEPLVPRDSPATVPGLRPFFLLRPDVLEGLGLIDGDRTVTITVDDEDGTREVDLEPITSPEFQAWAGPFGVIHLPQREGLRFTDEEAPLLTVEDAVRWRALCPAQGGPGRVLVGARCAPGGAGRSRCQSRDLRSPPRPGRRQHDLPEPALGAPGHRRAPLGHDRPPHLLGGLEPLDRDRADRPMPRFAGEPMGGGLNFWDDVNFIELEHLPIPMSVGISTRYWQKSFADDPRLTIEPDLLVPYRSAEYFAGVDLALEAVLSAP